MLPHRTPLPALRDMAYVLATIVTSLSVALAVFQPILPTSGDAQLDVLLGDDQQPKELVKRQAETFDGPPGLPPGDGRPSGDRPTPGERPNSGNRPTSGDRPPFGTNGTNNGGGRRQGGHRGNRPGNRNSTGCHGQMGGRPHNRTVNRRTPQQNNGNVASFRENKINLMNTGESGYHYQHQRHKGPGGRNKNGGRNSDQVCQEGGVQESTYGGEDRTMRNQPPGPPPQRLTEPVK